MRTLIWGLTLSIGVVASDSQAVVKVEVDGKEYTVTELMENCKSMTGAPEAQVACFTALSEMLSAKRGGDQGGGASVPDALNALREVAAYQDSETGLLVSGEDCKVQLTYYGNYFHISRRNVSSIDLYSARFDAGDLQYDTIKAQGGAGPLSSGVLKDGATAMMSGGVGLDSNQNKFASKSARATLDVYAGEVAGQLPAREDQTVEFVLVHPRRSDASEEIWAAFKTYVGACQA